MARANTKKLLTQQAAMLRNAGASASADAVMAIAEAVAPRGPLDLPLDKRQQIGAVTEGSGSVSDVIIAFVDLQNLLSPIAKKDVLADLGRLVDFLEEYREMSLIDLINRLKPAPVNGPDAIAKHIEALKPLYGEDGFEEAVQQLVRDRSVAPQDFARVAAAFDVKAGARDGKAKVAKALIRMHDNLATFRAKKRAMEGRSAA